MADDNELTSAQIQEIITKIKARWRGPDACPICLVDSWVLLPHLTAPVKLKGKTSSLNFPGKTLYPYAQVVCSNCGNTLTFNLSVLGVALDLPQTRAEALYGSDASASPIQPPRAVSNVLLDMLRAPKGKDDV